MWMEIQIYGLINKEWSFNHIGVLLIVPRYIP